jgi:hypothetical protein
MIRKIRELLSDENAFPGMGMAADWAIRYFCPLIMSASIGVGDIFGVLYRSFVSGAK